MLWTVVLWIVVLWTVVLWIVVLWTLVFALQLLSERFRNAPTARSIAISFDIGTYILGSLRLARSTTPASACQTAQTKTSIPRGHESLFSRTLASPA